MTSQALLDQARSAASTVRRVLLNRNLEPLVSGDYLTSSRDGTRQYLFVALDHQRIGRIEHYTSPDLLHQLSTALGGRPVVISNTTGLRYAILLAGRSPLADTIAYPGWRRGILQLGIDVRGPVSVPFGGFSSHVLVAGMTQMGKTNFLRLLLDQVIQEGARIQLIDPKAQFNSLRRHPARLTPAPSSYEDHRTALAVMKSVVAELHHRIELFTAVHEDGLTLDRYNALAREPLPRVFVVVDEFSGLVSAAGGPRSELSALVEQVAWHGAGLGLHLVLAGQAFDRELVGRVRDQAALRFCFRVEAPSLSRMIVGRAGAERLPVPGRALSTLGVIQTYRIEAMTTTQGPVPGLTPDELARAALILREHGGRLTSLAITRVWGVSNRQAQQISREWRARGLAAKTPASDNAVMLTPELVRQLEEAVRAGRV